MIKIVMIPIGELNKAEWNYKKNDEDLEAKLVENIRRNGILQVSAIYEEEDGRKVVLDGNHRLDAYNRLDFELVPCVNLGKITLARAKRISIELNETKFEYSKIKLAEIIGDMTDQFTIDELVLTLPFGEDELEGLRDLLDFDWNQYDNEESGGSKKKNRPVCHCPHCGHEFEE